MPSIKEMLNKIKAIGESVLDNSVIFTTLIIILVACSSFGLGRLSKLTEEKTEISFSNFVTEDNSANLSKAIDGNTQTTGKYVGSKNSDKYHTPWCSGAQRIKEENKIWFKSKAEAEAAGYTPASNCKGI